MWGGRGQEGQAINLKLETTTTTKSLSEFIEKGFYKTESCNYNWEFLLLTLYKKKKKKRQREREGGKT